MEAKDTVMDIAEDKYDGLGADTLVEIQAEISFKAGREESENKLVLLRAEADGYLSQLLDVQQDCIKARKAGIREVVDFSNDICILHGDADARVRQGKVLRKGNCYECWKAQLKEWGIK